VQEKGRARKKEDGEQGRRMDVPWRVKRVRPAGKGMRDDDVREAFPLETTLNARRASPFGAAHALARNSIWGAA